MAARELAVLMQRYEKSKEMFVAFDDAGKVTAANSAFRKYFSFLNYDDELDYDTIYRQCVVHRIFDNPDIYEDLDNVLAETKKWRSVFSAEDFVRRHSDGSVFLVQQRPLPSGGQYQVRTRLASETAEIATHSQLDATTLRDLGRALSPLPMYSLNLANSLMSKMVRAFAAVRTPVAITDAQGGIQYLNPAMLGVVFADDGISLRRGKFHFEHSSCQTRYETAIAECATADGDWGATTFSVRRGSGLPPYLFTVRALADLGPVVSDGPSGSLLSVFDPSRRPMPPKQHLIDLFKLSNAEAEVACLMGAGYSLREVAQQRGSALKTVRNQLTSVYAKVGVRGQSELVRVIGHLAEVFEK